MSVKSPLLKLSIVIGLLFCVMGIYMAVSWAMGDLYGYKARYAVESWQEEPSLPDLIVIDEAIADADRALSWESENPEYHELKARALYYKALVKGVDDLGKAYLVSAKQSHDSAAQLRPQWPYTWANMALMKAYLAEFDDEFHQALLNAVQYGPWERSVHLTIAHIGAMSWTSLSAEQKSIIAANVSRGLKHNYKGIAFNLDAYKRRNLICAYMHRDENQQRFCR